MKEAVVHCYAIKKLPAATVSEDLLEKLADVLQPPKTKGEN